MKSKFSSKGPVVLSFDDERLNQSLLRGYRKLQYMIVAESFILHFKTSSFPFSAVELLEVSERCLWWPKLCGRKGQIGLWLCHFQSQTGLVNQQKRVEIKTQNIQARSGNRFI